MHVPLPSTSRLSASLAPNSNVVAVFDAPAPSAVCASSAAKGKQQQALNASNKQKDGDAVFVAQFTGLPKYRRQLVVDTYAAFAACEKIAAQADPNALLTSGPTTEQVQYYSRIFASYKEHVFKHLKAVHDEQGLSPAVKTREQAHFSVVQDILSLAHLLFAPSSGSHAGLVTEEILDWINTVDVAPTTQEGIRLIEMSEPWADAEYWTYIYRAVLRGHTKLATTMLDTLSSHEASVVRDSAQAASAALSQYPRSTSYSTEDAFTRALRAHRAQLLRHKSHVEALMAEASPADSEEEESLMEIEAAFNVLFEVMEGVEDRLLDYDLVGTWRDALGAFLLWQQPMARRSDIPSLVRKVTKALPVDHTLLSESVQCHLLQGDVPRVLQQCNELDAWLVAHLSDIFEKLAVIENDSIFSQSLRDYFVLSYADLLQSDTTLWRVTVDYLSTCGIEGRARMSKVLMHVPLVERLEPAQENDDAMDEGEEGAERKMTTVEEVLFTCIEHEMPEEMEAICRIHIERLCEDQRFGEAVAFAVRAGDTKRLARIARRVLDCYVTDGQDAFVRHVDSIPTSLLHPGADAPVASKLQFLSRYRDFFAMMARDEHDKAASLLVLLMSSGVAPKRFWAVMMLDILPLLDTPELLVSLPDTYELLRLLDSVTAPVVAKQGRDVFGNLDLLCRVVGARVERDEQSRAALKQLDIVRGALARHLGRCMCYT